MPLCFSEGKKQPLISNPTLLLCNVFWSLWILRNCTWVFVSVDQWFSNAFTTGDRFYTGIKKPPNKVPKLFGIVVVLVGGSQQSCWKINIKLLAGSLFLLVHVGHFLDQAGL